MAPPTWYNYTTVGPERWSATVPLPPAVGGSAHRVEPELMTEEALT
jgi:hypothetical protein